VNDKIIFYLFKNKQKNNKMAYIVKVKPYGENEEHDTIDDFDDEELDIILELFKSLARKCEKEYEEISDVKVKRDGKFITIKYSISSSSPEDDFLFYLETLTGHSSENIMTIEEIDYSIKGSPVIEKKDDDDDFIDSYNALVADLAPDIINN
jgi:predicted house-cleaning noncanonical NTP pyrophosphatase (MazG superfamily)